MKSIRNMCSNIAWICKPYKKYGLYLLLSIVIMGLYSPIDDFFYVYTPEIILKLLTDGKPFHIVVAIAASLTFAAFLNSAILKLARAYFAKQRTSINLQANREIYEKAVHVDYKYIDDLKYYDNFAWAVEEYSTQLENARKFLIDFAQCMLSIILLGTLIATLGPWILLAEVIQMLLHVVVNKYMNSISIKYKEEQST